MLVRENDGLAFGAMDVARFDFGLTIPSDVAVVDYDNNDS
jgi:LacI family transcriptional regulator